MEQVVYVTTTTITTANTTLQYGLWPLINYQAGSIISTYYIVLPAHVV